MFYFHILDLNVNQWVPLKGCILGIWTNGPCVVITTSVETLDRLWLYCYTNCMLGRAPRTKETLPDFCENMDFDKWDIIVWYQVTQNPQEFNRLTGCQRDPRILGRHKNMAHLFPENFTSEGIFGRNKP